MELFTLIETYVISDIVTHHGTGIIYLDSLCHTEGLLPAYYYDIL